MKDLSNLDKVRKLVASGEVKESIEKYGILFVIHINKRVEKLLKSNACINGKITEDYYKLNNLFPTEITSQSKVNIRYWRNDITNDMNSFLYKKSFIGISNLEVSFLYLVRSYTLDLITILFDLDISFDLLITDNLSTSDEGKVIMKKLFKKLETINKEITIMFKIAGYLKHLRIEQRLTTNHLYGVLDGLSKYKSFDIYTQAGLSKKHTGSFRTFETDKDIVK